MVEFCRIAKRRKLKIKFVDVSFGVQYTYAVQQQNLQDQLWDENVLLDTLWVAKLLHAD